MASSNNAEAKLIDFIGQFSKDPLGFAKSVYEWDDGDLRGSPGPRKWQGEVLDAIGKHLREPATRFRLLRIAVASGRGIGKSGLIGMITHWAMSTCVDTKVVVTANTDTQLRTKTMPEIAKWFRNAINAHWFKTTATAIASTAQNHETSWRTDAIPWSENNPAAFRGLHNLRRRIVLIFDEASDIADVIWDSSEGSFTDVETEMLWIAFSNPSRNIGRFRECFGKAKHWWSTRQIDSRTVEGTDQGYFSELINYWGEDSDHIRVQVKGEFPRFGSMQFISSQIVEEARKREAIAGLYDPFVLGCDIARFGDDDTVLYARRGRDARSIAPIRLRALDTMQVAARISELHEFHKFDAIFIDGGGVGGGVIDRLRQLGHDVIEVQFGGSADRSQLTSSGPIAYANKRAEIWGYMRDWLPGGAIPDDPALAAELASVQYGYALRDGRDAVLLERKADMKKRGLASPDAADALALTFAYPVVPKDHTDQFERRSSHQVEYDPLGRDRVVPSAKQEKHQVNYNYNPRGL